MNELKDVNIDGSTVKVFSDSGNYSETPVAPHIQIKENVSKENVQNDAPITEPKSSRLSFQSISSLLLIGLAIAAILGADSLYNYGEDLADIYYSIAHMIMFPIFLVGGLIIWNKK